MGQAGESVLTQVGQLTELEQTKELKMYQSDSGISRRVSCCTAAGKVGLRNLRKIANRGSA